MKDNRYRFVGGDAGNKPAFKRAWGLSLAFFLILVLAAPVLANDTVPLRAQVLAAVDIKSVFRQDLSKGSIKGEAAEYTLLVSTLWNGYLSAYRESPVSKSKALEKIDFYYEPQNKGDKPAYLMSLYVYNCSDWHNPSGQRKIIESSQYVFAVQSATENNMTMKTDKAIFSVFLGQANDDKYLKSLISLPSGQSILQKNVVTVNGRVLACETNIVDDTVYVPVRSVCEALGYKVTRMPAEQSVSIMGGRSGYLLSTDNKTFNTVNINGHIYVTSVFFTQKMKAGVEVDENANVWITE